MNARLLPCWDEPPFAVLFIGDSETFATSCAKRVAFSARHVYASLNEADGVQ